MKFDKIKFSKIFNEKIDEFLESDLHIFNCAANSEGQACCLDKGSNYNSGCSRNNVEQIIVDILNKL